MRTNGKCFTVVRQAGTEPDECRAAVNALCGLALEFAHGFIPSARDGPKHWCAPRQCCAVQSAPRQVPAVEGLS